MTVAADERVGQRAPLSRRRILQEALRYVDAHGLAGLSMHKLGAELGVKGMSLYNHVVNKHDILDGVVELLWDEIETAAPARADWREGFRSFAYALRDTIHRHPNAAQLITAQQIMPEAALRCIRAHIRAATDDGVPQERAYALLRTIASYALGTALNEVAWGTGCAARQPTSVEDLLRPGVPAELAAVAEIFCGQADPDAQFELGLELMARSIDNIEETTAG